MTLDELRTLLRDNSVEYIIKSHDKAVAQIHVLVDREETNVTTD